MDKRLMKPIEFILEWETRDEFMDKLKEGVKKLNEFYGQQLSELPDHCGFLMRAYYYVNKNNVNNTFPINAVSVADMNIDIVNILHSYEFIEENKFLYISGVKSFKDEDDLQRTHIIIEVTGV